jgi:hypothetical protein
VKISLHAAPFAIGRFDNARARLLHGVELDSKLNLKSGVLQGEANGGRDCVDELGFVA